MGNLDAPSLQVHTQIWLLGPHLQLRNLKNLNDFGQMSDSLRALIFPISETGVVILILLLKLKSLWGLQLRGSSKVDHERDFQAGERHQATP